MEIAEGMEEVEDGLFKYLKRSAVVSNGCKKHERTCTDPQQMRHPSVPYLRPQTES